MLQDVLLESTSTLWALTFPHIGDSVENVLIKFKIKRGQCNTKTGFYSRRGTTFHGSSSLVSANFYIISTHQGKYFECLFLQTINLSDCV